MTLQKKPCCPKKQYRKIGIDRKLFVIDEIINGRYQLITHQSDTKFPELD